MRPVHLRMARAALGWTLREFAEKCGVNKNTIARYEAGEAILTDTLEKLESVLRQEGVVFIEADQELGPGVRIRNAPITMSTEGRTKRRSKVRTPTKRPRE